jgi:hypothetical protein
MYRPAIADSTADTRVSGEPAYSLETALNDSIGEGGSHFGRKAEQPDVAPAANERIRSKE